ncbi:MAG: hypothetical protein NZ602_16310 [Thermoguttaceae bacterium]|nr:hypothetical protein [Thermoguttaceae bacterium]MDW8037725.1 hypothetical protein [Thermoguttaceae bacterium]
MAQPDKASAAAEEICRCLAGAPMSAEVRHVLESFQRRFPEPFGRILSGEVATGGRKYLGFGEEFSTPSFGVDFRPIAKSLRSPLQPPTKAQIEALVGELESDSYAQRRWAADQLRAYVDRPEWAGLLLGVFQSRLAQGDISADLRRWLEPLWERAWGAWLASGVSGNELPQAKPGEIHDLLDQLAGGLSGGSGQGLRSIRQVQRRLQMLLARDDQVALIREAIEQRLKTASLPPEAESRLTELADLCRPAMVAEYWYQGQHRGIQHLLVGVPSQVPGAPRASHFDYIDDTRAHCVSGSNLQPGDYPVGVAIPHPNQLDAFFHLVNLPTPRRRMAYEYLVQRPMRQRLAEITQRTCQYYLRRRQPLSVREILVLAQLEPQQVSQFASEWLRTMLDEPVSEVEWHPDLMGARQWEGLRIASPNGQMPRRPSRHAILCLILAERGTKEAIPGLLEALSGGRLLPPSDEWPYAWGWVAALAIAVRDPWPEVDEWLVSLVPRTQPLRILTPGEVKGPDFSSDPPVLGATAAGLLLLREPDLDLSTSNIILHKHLGRSDDPVLGKYKVPGFRFSHPKAPEEFLQWWKSRQLQRRSTG